MDKECELFSRTLEREHFENAIKIFKNLTKAGFKGELMVHTYELYDKAFTFPRVRRYEYVQ